MEVLAMRLKQVLFMILLGGVLATPTPARADWIFTPYIGGNFGGDAKDADLDFENNLAYGASIGYMGAGVIGFEFDFGYSPNFFDDQGTNAFDANVTSLMANLIIGVPVGGQTGPGIRPYVSGGAGLLRTRVDDVEDFFDLDENAFGINVGGGVMGFFTDHVGMRGDIRYFRAFKDVEENGVDLRLGDFDFWRGTVGVAFRF
jgi:opacity protein-like surface antigen